ncbi:sulfotransferase [Paraglaciecola sp.]|uniref:sulfotransferase family protein n=1 Tax=Paraglaciecola sp. TaxID=1920173 RepID=UPI00326699D8
MSQLPKFICIGAQRAGTTWLHECLSEHPDVYVPPEKELHFFDRFYDRGISSYQDFFKAEKTGNAKVWGELTPNYYQEDQALERIKAHIPDVKLIYILREPVSRAYSQYQLYKPSQFSEQSFEEVIATQPFVTDLSLQGKHLERTYSLFAKEQVLVLFYDDLSSDPKSTLEKVYSFIDVKSDFIPEHLDKRINRVVLPDLQEKLQKFGLGWLIDLVKASPFSEWVKEFFHKTPKKKQSDPMVSQMQGTFKEDIKLIEKLLDVDLTAWRQD